jgi:8-oxo-dGTP pyrophosphatase MutT (NUDIX family)
MVDVSKACWEEWISKKAVANAGVVVVNFQKQVLLLYKLGTKEWGLPSGGIDKGEKPIEAAVRELREETGINLPVELLTEIYTATAIHENDKTDIIVTFLAYPVVLKEIKVSEEHVDSKWLHLDEYNNQNIHMHGATRESIKVARNFVYKNDVMAK